MANPSTPVSRTVLGDVERRLQALPVVVLTGARQTGKTTLARELGARTGRRFISLDPLETREQARKSPASLLGGDSPLTIDEAQRAPELLLEIKAAVDLDRTPGRFLLTGSANLLLMKEVSDSLAGRAVYSTLRPLSERERRGEPQPRWTDLLSAPTLAAALERIPPHRAFDWRRAALRGGMPALVGVDDPAQRRLWFEGYVDTYLHRDLRDLSQISDLSAFRRVIELATLQTGGLLNVAQLAHHAGLSRATVQRWLALLEISYVTTPVPPYFESRLKRLVKTPKLYALDTALALFILGVHDVEALERLRSVGLWLENLVLNDLLVWRETHVPRPELFHFRSHDRYEVDFVVELDRRAIPIEIKSGERVRVDDASGIDRFCSELPDRAPYGLVLYSGAEARQLSEHALAVPLGCVL
jgi:predicted AAA+ superfamily ATPase